MHAATQQQQAALYKIIFQGDWKGLWWFRSLKMLAVHPVLTSVLCLFSVQFDTSQSDFAHFLCILQ